MKFTIVLLALAAVVVSDSPSVRSRGNLIVGRRQPGDLLLIQRNFFKPAVANQQQSEYYEYRGNANRRITYIRALERGAQRVTARIVSGGIGQSHVRIHYLSDRGFGFNYQLEIYGF